MKRVRLLEVLRALQELGFTAMEYITQNDLNSVEVTIHRPLSNLSKNIPIKIKISETTITCEAPNRNLVIMKNFAQTIKNWLGQIYDFESEKNT